MTRWAQNSLFDPIFRFAETFGCSPAEICAAVGVDMDKTLAVGALVPAAQVVDAVEWCAERSGYRSFGLMLASRMDYRIVGLAALQAERAHSLAHHYELLRAYLPLQSEGYSFVFAPEAAGAAGRLLIHGRGAFQARHFVEGVLAVHTRWLRHLLGADWTPRGVEFSHQQLGAPADYRAAFHAPVRFNVGRNAMLFSPEDLSWRSPGSHDAWRQVIDREVMDLALIEAHDHVAHVRRIIGALLPGPVQLKDVAAELAMSSRSLQRRLGREGTNFNTQLAQARVALAQEYLRHPGVTVAEVAARLGFSHVSVLSRLLRRELGASPKARTGAG